MNDLARAKAELKRGDFTLVLSGRGEIVTSVERGVKPLLELLGEQKTRGMSAADRVVGKAAAFLYVLLGVREVYADVMSVPAKEVLLRFGIGVEYGTLTEAIRNRSSDGFCPMETAVREIDDPQTALAAIRKKISELQKT